MSSEPGAEVARRRRALFEYLVTAGIRPQVHYIPVPWQPWYKRRQEAAAPQWPGAESYYAGCLSLPLYPAMTDEDVIRVVERIGSFLASA
jgi:dTDP-4-amino-4,6-dideoxygalactose transaminase